MDKSLDRRNFIKLSAAGAAGSILAGSGALRAAELKNAQPDGDNGIIHRTLGKTGIRVPVVNLGVMRADNPRIVTMALDGGMTLLDTAHSYQNGRNEEMLGELLKDRPRDSFYLATKIRGNNEEELMGQFNTSMKRLQLDYVDILYFHRPTAEQTLDPELLGIMKKIRDSGRAKFLAVSTHSNMPEVIRAAIKSNVYDLVCTSYNFNLENLGDLNQAVAEAAEAGIGVIAMKTMAGAYWDRERQDPINTKAALKFALQNENIHTSIPGVTAFHELEENFEVNRDITMTEQEIKDLRLDQQTAGLFCLGCESCIAQCPQKMPVPDIMRSYMYAYGYKDLSLARSTMDSLSLQGDACSNCSSCSVKCVQGFNVAQRIKDIDRIRQIPGDFLA